MALTIKCPECGHEHGAPEPGTRKITCESCGMIVVMKKVLGEDWEKQLEAAASGGAPKKAAPVVKRRRRAAPDAEDESSGGGRRRPSTHGSSRRRSTRGGRRRGAGEAEPEEADGGGRPRTGHRPKRKNDMPPALLFGSVIAVIAIAAVIYMTVLKSDDGGGAADKGAEKASAKTEDAAGVASEGNGAADAGSADGESTDGEKPADSDGDAGEKTVSKKEPVKKKKDKYAPFENSPGTTDAELAAIKSHIETLRDLNATHEAATAMEKLRDETPKKAIPLLINALLELKKDDEDEVKRGWQIMQALQMSAYRKDDWDRTFLVLHWPESLEEISKAADERTVTVKYWWRWWDENKEKWEPPKEDEEEEW